MIVSISVDDPGWEAIPALEKLARSAANATLAAVGAPHENLEIALLFTGDAAAAALNAKWRGKTNATNVLSFPAKDAPLPPDVARPLGDIVLAAGVVESEATEQGKTFADHATHLIVHGLLHLLGYDHKTDEESDRMQRLEIRVLRGLGIPNPYEAPA